MSNWGVRPDTMSLLNAQTLEVLQRLREWWQTVGPTLPRDGTGDDTAARGQYVPEAWRALERSLWRFHARWKRGRHRRHLHRHLGRFWRRVLRDDPPSRANRLIHALHDSRESTTADASLLVALELAATAVSPDTASTPCAVRALEYLWEAVWVRRLDATAWHRVYPCMPSVMRGASETAPDAEAESALERVFGAALDRALRREPERGWRQLAHLVEAGVDWPVGGVPRDGRPLPPSARTSRGVLRWLQRQVVPLLPRALGSELPAAPECALRILQALAAAEANARPAYGEALAAAVDTCVQWATATVADRQRASSRLYESLYVLADAVPVHDDAGEAVHRPAHRALCTLWRSLEQESGEERVAAAVQALRRWVYRWQRPSGRALPPELADALARRRHAMLERERIGASTTSGGQAVAQNVTDSPRLTLLWWQCLSAVAADTADAKQRSTNGCAETRTPPQATEWQVLLAAAERRASAQPSLAFYLVCQALQQQQQQMPAVPDAHLAIAFGADLLAAPATLSLGGLWPQSAWQCRRRGSVGVAWRAAVALAEDAVTWLAAQLSVEGAATHREHHTRRLAETLTALCVVDFFGDEQALLSRLVHTPAEARWRWLQSWGQLGAKDAPSPYLSASEVQHMVGCRARQAAAAVANREATSPATAWLWRALHDRFGAIMTEWMQRVDEAVPRAARDWALPPESMSLHAALDTMRTVATRLVSALCGTPLPSVEMQRYALIVCHLPVMRPAAITQWRQALRRATSSSAPADVDVPALAEALRQTCTEMAGANTSLAEAFVETARRGTQSLYVAGVLPPMTSISWEAVKRHRADRFLQTCLAPTLRQLASNPWQEGDFGLLRTTMDPAPEPPSRPSQPSVATSARDRQQLQAERDRHASQQRAYAEALAAYTARQQRRQQLRQWMHEAHVVVAGMLVGWGAAVRADRLPPPPCACLVEHAVALLWPLRQRLQTTYLRAAMAQLALLASRLPAETTGVSGIRLPDALRPAVIEALVAEPKMRRRPALDSLLQTVDAALQAAPLQGTAAALSAPTAALLSPLLTGALHNAVPVSSSAKVSTIALRILQRQTAYVSEAERAGYAWPLLRADVVAAVHAALEHAVTVSDDDDLGWSDACQTAECLATTLQHLLERSSSSASSSSSSSAVAAGRDACALGDEEAVLQRSLEQLAAGAQSAHARVRYVWTEALLRMRSCATDLRRARPLFLLAHDVDAKVSARARTAATDGASAVSLESSAEYYLALLAHPHGAVQAAAANALARLLAEAHARWEASGGTAPFAAGRSLLERLARRLEDCLQRRLSLETDAQPTSSVVRITVRERDARADAIAAADHAAKGVAHAYRALCTPSPPPPPPDSAAASPLLPLLLQSLCACGLAYPDESVRCTLEDAAVAAVQHAAPADIPRAYDAVTAAMARIGRDTVVTERGRKALVASSALIQAATVLRLPDAAAVDAEPTALLLLRNVVMTAAAHDRRLGAATAYAAIVQRRARRDDSMTTTLTAAAVEEQWQEAVSSASAPECRRGAAILLAALVQAGGTRLLAQTQLLDRAGEALTTTNASDTIAKEGVLGVLAALAERLGAAFEPYGVRALPLLLQTVSDSHAAVRAASQAAARAFMAQLTPQGVRLVLPPVTEALAATDANWRTRTACLELLVTTVSMSPHQLAYALPQLMPHLTAALTDVHPRVQAAATRALQALVVVALDDAGEADGEQMAAVVLEAFRQPERHLASALALLSTRWPTATTTVRTTTTTNNNNSEQRQRTQVALHALLLPLLQRGLAHRSSAVKRSAMQVLSEVARQMDTAAATPNTPSTSSSSSSPPDMAWSTALSPSLQQALCDPQPEIRDAAAVALGSIARLLGCATASADALPPALQQLVETLWQQATAGERPVAERSGAAHALACMLSALPDDGVASTRAALQACTVQRALQTLWRAAAEARGRLHEEPDRDATPPRADAAARQGALELLRYVGEAAGGLDDGDWTEAWPLMVRALGDDSDAVREAALAAAHTVLHRYAARAEYVRTVLLPPLTAATTDAQWRVRGAACRLLGQLLDDMAPGREDVADDRNTDHRVAHWDALLGTDGRNALLARLLLLRHDPMAGVRETAHSVCKALVRHAARVQRETLRPLVHVAVFELLLPSSSVEEGAAAVVVVDDERQHLAGAALADAAAKMADEALPQIVPPLLSALQSAEDAHWVPRRRAVAAVLDQVAQTTPRAALQASAETLWVPATLQCLRDADEAVRAAGGALFARLYRTLGERATMETIVQPLLEEKEEEREVGTSSTSASTVMAALQQIFAGPAGARLLALAVPQWLAAYRVTALATAAEASGRLFEAFAPAVIQRALSEANARQGVAVATADDEHSLAVSADVDTAESSSSSSSWLWEALVRATPDTAITHLLPRLGDSAVASRVVAATAVERWTAAVPDAAVLVSHGEAVLEALLPGMVDPDAQVRHRTYRAFVVLTERVPVRGGSSSSGSSSTSSWSNLWTASALRTTRTAWQQVAALRDTDNPPSPWPAAPFITLYTQCVLHAVPEAREQAALAIAELAAAVPSATHLQPHLMKLTGPLIRVLAERWHPWQVQAAVLLALVQLLQHGGGSALRAFVPQLQSTFLKYALEEQRMVRARSVEALAVLMRQYRPRPEAMWWELVTVAGGGCGRDTSAPSWRRLAALEALRATVWEWDGKGTAETVSAVQQVARQALGDALDAVRQAGARVLGALLHAQAGDAEAVSRLWEAAVPMADSDQVVAAAESVAARHGRLLAIEALLHAGASSSLLSSSMVWLPPEYVARIEIVLERSLDDEAARVRAAAWTTAAAAVMYAETTTRSLPASIRPSITTSVDWVRRAQRAVQTDAVLEVRDAAVCALGQLGDVDAAVAVLEAIAHGKRTTTTTTTTTTTHGCGGGGDAGYPVSLRVRAAEVLAQRERSAR